MNSRARVERDSTKLSVPDLENGIGLTLADEEARRTVIEASRTCLISHYEARDIDAVMSWFAEDIVWLGPLTFQHSTGKAAMRAIIEPEYGTGARIKGERWSARPVGKDWLVAGMMIVCPDGENGEVLPDFQQSVTFFWRLTEDGPRAYHLHLSTAYDCPLTPETLSSAGDDGIEAALRAAERKTEAASIVRSRAMPGKLTFKTAAGEFVYLDDASVLFAVAQGKSCRIVHDGGEVRLSETLAELERELPSTFVRIHRSHIVNASRVRSIGRFFVMTEDGTRHPVPERRYTEVRKLLEEHHKA